MERNGRIQLTFTNGARCWVTGAGGAGGWGEGVGSALVLIEFEKLV